MAEAKVPNWSRFLPRNPSVAAPLKYMLSILLRECFCAWGFKFLVELCFLSRPDPKLNLSVAVVFLSL